MRLKFKVGDFVVPRRIAILGSPNKNKYFGQICQIRSIQESVEFKYRLTIDSHYSWSDEELDLVLCNEHQKCAECQKSCPHAQPNQTDNSYVCVACLTIKELE